jgi:Ca-activated chloride channel family protein
MRLAEPGWLVLLVLALAPWFWERARPRLSWPTLDGFSSARRFGAALLRLVPPLCRTLAVACMVTALARPQTVGGRIRVAGQGVAIVVALDHSSSMNAADFPSGDGKTVSRLEAARNTFARFVAGRGDDLIGLIVFANYPFRACPPTLGHDFLLERVRSIRPARPGDDGTNLGHALALGIEDLRVARPKKKVLILLTDGRDAPAVPHPLDPEAAARLARELGVTLHTIAIGQAGGIVHLKEPTTGLDVSAQVDAPDFALLERLARLGGGRAFSAADENALGQVFHEIDALERSPVRGEVRTRYNERYHPWAAAALGLLVLDRLLVSSRLRRLP